MELNATQGNRILTHFLTYIFNTNKKFQKKLFAPDLHQNNFVLKHFVLQNVLKVDVKIGIKFIPVL